VSGLVYIQIVRGVRGNNSIIVDDLHENARACAITVLG